MAGKLLIKKETVVKLFEHLGFKTAKRWDNKKLLAKIKKLPDITDGVVVKNSKVKKALKAILVADKVVFKGEEDSGPEPSKKKSKKVKKVKKAKKAGKKAEKKSGKPGVIMSVLEFVRSDGPISEKQILAKLKKRFPDRDSKSMESTIPCIPGYLSRKKNITNVKKNNKGQFYIKR